MKVITVTNLPHLAQPLVASLQKHGWDYHVIECDWRGFGTKLIETYNYLKANPEVTEFIFCDAHDVVVLGNESEFKGKLGLMADKIVCSGERGLWPPPLIPFRCEYDKYPHRFDYINSGLCYAPSKLFIELFDKYPPFYEIDDQYWFNLCYLLRDKNMLGSMITIDNDQKIFNSHSFIDEGEYTYDNGRIGINGNLPLFIHSNGRTMDEKLNQMLAI